MEARLIALLVVAACTGKGSTAPTNSASGSGSGSAERPVAAVAVTDRATATPNLGKMVEVHGTAKNAKLAAVVIAKDLVVYCLGTDSWPAKLANTEVVARGTLEQTDEFSTDDDASAGTKGKVYVLRACAY